MALPLGFLAAGSSPHETSSPSPARSRRGLRRRVVNPKAIGWPECDGRSGEERAIPLTPSAPGAGGPRGHQHLPVLRRGLSTQLVYAKQGKPIHIEGDPEPVNEGTPARKAPPHWAVLSEQRINHVMYRAPHSDHWERRPLDWAMEQVAQRVKQTRDETFVEQLPDGKVINHTLGIGSLGGATLDNEENYLIKKLLGGGLGLVNIENQAHTDTRTSVPSLGTTFGRGAATLATWDLANADCIVVMGSNMAENHPVAFRFVTQAQAKGATVIHMDPRFTRTSALANIHAPIRSGSDIAFLGGVIRYILFEDKWFREFALAYTNIATIIEDGFIDTEDGNGVFSGFQEKSASYVQDSCRYKGQMVPPAIAEHHVPLTDNTEARREEITRRPPPTDETLQHPNCVYQIMRRHFARYTPDGGARHRLLERHVPARVRGNHPQLRP